ncbi:MAG: peptidoglycan DD-metalloendopeptidase family protein [Polyangiaceae bacterium]|jgi:murein DD-endopeptidase MepM/ murein hydrolase activator NlpD|nr:peptidoglycan DD-metalloendopeptidase family protein [Polyangiaceae bacterium]
MKKTTAIVLGMFVALGGGVALGVPKSPTSALDEFALQAGRGAAGRGAARAPIKIPQSPLEVDIALKQLESERGALEQELAGLDKELGLVDGRVLARGRTYYKQVRAGLLPAGGGFDELVDYAARVERTRLGLTRDLESQKSMRARREEVSDLLLRIGADIGPLEAQKRAYDSAKTTMRQAQERGDAFDRAFDSSTPPPDQITVYGADLQPGDVGATSPLEGMMGKLPLPLAGRAQVTKLEASGASGPALELRAPSGATARAVAAGRVVFADRYEDDRITVILDHGNRLFTLYGHLRSAEVKVGETVASGSALGPVADRKRESLLYFELRKEGRPVDPGPWFGL